MSKINNFHRLYQEDDRYLQVDHRRIRSNIHSQFGQLKFIGNVSDMFLSKIFTVAGMTAGARPPLSRRGDQGPVRPPE
jgi:hypothetical protein